MLGAISEKFRTFDMRIYFAIPPFFSLWTVIGGIFFLISKLRNFYRIVNQFVEIIASVSGQSLSIQKYSVFPNLNIQKNRILAFYELSRYRGTQPEGKKVIFIDERPWMDVPKSRLIAVPENFGDIAYCIVIF